MATKRAPKRNASSDTVMSLMSQMAPMPSNPQPEKQAAARGSRALQEAVNAVTMLPHTAMVLMSSEPVPLVFRALVTLHTCASIFFHVVLVGQHTQMPSVTSRPRLAQRAMNVDMALIFAISLTANMMLATSFRSGAVGVALAAVGIYGTVNSKAVDRRDVEAELMRFRYPLVFLTITSEALLAWLCRGDAVNAAGIFGTICIIGGLSLADDALGGWGHPLGHLACIPGMCFRSGALLGSTR